MDITGKYNVILIVVMFYIFYRVSFVMVIPHICINNHMNVYELIIILMRVAKENPPSSSRTTYLNVVIKMKMFPKNLFLEFMLL